jgi:hypothetical protein
MRRIYALVMAAVILAAGCSAKKNIDPEKDYIAGFTGTGDFTITGKYSADFESASEFDGFYIVPQGYMGTSSHELTNTVKCSGNYSHYAWMYGANSVIPGTNTNHRGYPTIQLHKLADGPFSGMVFCEFFARLNLTMTAQADKNWFSFATFCSYSDDNWYRVYLVNLGEDGTVQLMHVPGQTQGVKDIFQTTTKVFPMNQWVKLSVLIDYTSQNQYTSPYIKVWQDGELVSAARFNPRVDPYSVPTPSWPPCLSTWGGSSITEAESLCGLTYTGGLAQAHFGLYAPPLFDSGEVWNDSLVIYELTR